MKINNLLIFLVVLIVGCEMKPFMNIQESDQVYIIPKNTSLILELQTPLSSNVNVRGDTFYAYLKRPIIWEGKTILPQNVKIEGIVKHTTRYEKFGDQASLLLFFDQLVLPNNKEIPIVSSLDTSLAGNAIKIKGKAEEDAQMIFKSSMGGAFLGGMSSGGAGAKVAGAGTAFGAVAVLLSDMQNIQLTVGTEIAIILQEDLFIPKEGS